MIHHKTQHFLAEPSAGVLWLRLVAAACAWTFIFHGHMENKVPALDLP